jgi:hypothetical protein
MLGGLGWKARQLLTQYRPAYLDPVATVRRTIGNRRALAAPSIAYIYAEPTNTGDYASYLGVRQLAGRSGAELFCSRWALPQTFRLLERGRWSAIIVGGGGLLQECFEPFWERLLASTSAPLILFGIGVNELEGLRRGVRRDLLTAIATRADAIHARDRMTAAQLPGATVGVCPSVNYLAALPRPAPADGDLLVHAVHSADFTAAGGSLPTVRERLQVAAREMGIEYRELDHNSGLTTGVIDAYRRARVVVSSRLHGCIFGYALGRPVLAITCDRKTQAFIDTHAPSMERVTPTEAAQLTARDLDAVVARGALTPPRAVLAVNQARMAGILDAVLGVSVHRE